MNSVQNAPLVITLRFPCSSSLVSPVLPEVHHETEGRWRTRISLHEEKPPVHWCQWRVGGIVLIYGSYAADSQMLESETRYCPADTSPRRQTTAAARARTKGAIPANTMKPERNYQSLLSSTSKQTTQQLPCQYLNRLIRPHTRVPTSL